LAEDHGEFPALALCCGRFDGGRGDGGLHLAVLHPREISVRQLVPDGQGGHALQILARHPLPAPGHSIKTVRDFRGFSHVAGEAPPVDALLVQTIDGRLLTFPHPALPLDRGGALGSADGGGLVALRAHRERRQGNFLVPGPIVHVPPPVGSAAIDDGGLLVTATAAFEVQALSLGDPAWVLHPPAAAAAAYGGFAAASAGDDGGHERASVWGVCEAGAPLAGVSSSSTSPPHSRASRPGAGPLAAPMAATATTSAPRGAAPSPVPQWRRGVGESVLALELAESRAAADKAGVAPPGVQHVLVLTLGSVLALDAGTGVVVWRVKLQDRPTALAVAPVPGVPAEGGGYRALVAFAVAPSLAGASSGTEAEGGGAAALAIHAPPHGRSVWAARGLSPGPAVCLLVSGDGGWSTAGGRMLHPRGMAGESASGKAANNVAHGSLLASDGDGRLWLGDLGTRPGGALGGADDVAVPSPADDARVAAQLAEATRELAPLLGKTTESAAEMATRSARGRAAADRTGVSVRTSVPLHAETSGSGDGPDGSPPEMLSTDHENEFDALTSGLGATSIAQQEESAAASATQASIVASLWLSAAGRQGLRGVRVTANPPPGVLVDPGGVLGLPDLKGRGAKGGAAPSTPVEVRLRLTHPAPVVVAALRAQIASGIRDVAVGDRALAVAAAAASKPGSAAPGDLPESSPSPLPPAESVCRVVVQWEEGPRDDLCARVVALPLPLSLIFRPIPLVPDVDDVTTRGGVSVTLSCDRAPPLPALLEDLLQERPELASSSSARGAVRGWTDVEARICARACSEAQGTVVVKASTLGGSGRLHIRAASLHHLWLPLREIVHRVAMWDHGGSGVARSTRVVPEGPLPWPALWAEVEAHLDARAARGHALEELADRSAEHRAVLRRLHSRFGEKMPAPLEHLDELLDETAASARDAARDVARCEGVAAARRERARGAARAIAILVRCAVGLDVAIVGAGDVPPGNESAKPGTAAAAAIAVCAALDPGAPEGRAAAWEEAAGTAAAKQLAGSGTSRFGGIGAVDAGGGGGTASLPGEAPGSARDAARRARDAVDGWKTAVGLLATAFDELVARRGR